MNEQMTKLDRKRAADELRAVREKNVQELEAKLKRAEDVLAVIPIPTQKDSYEKEKELREERMLVSATIGELTEMLDDERGALELIGTDYHLANASTAVFKGKEV